MHTDLKSDYTSDGLYRPQAFGEELKTVHTSTKEQRRQEAEQMPKAPAKVKKIEDDSKDKHDSSSWGYPTRPGGQPEPLALQDSTGPHAESPSRPANNFARNMFAILAVLIGVCYYMGKNGIKITIPGSSAPKYGRL